MGVRSQYKTKHYSELLDYLETIPGTHFTVADICDHFSRESSPIGTTTVYRQLERLVDEGYVTKYITGANSPACFEYVDPKQHGTEEVCFHCKCEKCGKLIHLHCHELAGIQAHLKEQHEFLLTPTRTVLYGICEECQADVGGKLA